MKERKFEEALVQTVAQAAPDIQPAISRRGFFALASATGIATLISPYPAVLKRAYADESGTETYEIYVVRRSEVPVCVYDVSNADNPTPVEGMNVTVTSLCTGNAITVATDSTGTAIIDLNQSDNVLSEDPHDDQLGPAPYQCWASIVIEKDGYRAFEAGRVRLAGTQSFGAGTEPDDGTPYLRCLTLDGWDIQYTSPQTFICAAGNRDDHELLVKVARVADGTKVVADMKQGKLADSHSVEASNGAASLTFAGPYLSTHADDAGKAFTLGETLSLTVTAEGADAFSVATTAVFEIGCCDDQDSDSDDEGFVVSRVHPSQSSAVSQPSSFTMPDCFPGIGGSALKGWIPGIPYVVQVDPAGYMKFGAKFNGSLYRNTAGQPDSLGWKTSTYEEAKKRAQDDAGILAIAKMMASSAKNLGDPSFFKPQDLGIGAGLTVNAELGLSGVLEWDWEDINYWSGGVVAYAILSLDAAIIEEFVAVCVPVFIKFDFRLALQFVLDLMVATDSEGKGNLFEMLSDMALTDGSDISMETTITAGLSLGVGAANCASISVRGGGTIGMRIICPINPTVVDPDKPYPRFVIFASVSVTVAVQFFVFKASVSLYDGSWPSLYDNWGDGDGFGGAQICYATPERDEFLLRMPDGSLAYSASTLNSQAVETAVMRSLGTLSEDCLQLITNEELQQTAEFKATQTPSDGNDQPIFTYESLRTTPATPCTFDILLALGEDGAKPVETLIQEDVYSDVRPRIITVDSTTYAFRLLTVEYPGDNGAVEMRTRLTYAPYKDDAWGEAQVIEFQFDDGAKASRVDTYDYDYDLAAKDSGTWDDGGALRIFMVCGTRPNGDDSTFEEVSNHTIAVFLSLRHNESKSKFDMATKEVWFDWYDEGGALVNPRITNVDDGTNKRYYQDYPNVSCIFAFFREVDSTSPSGYKENPLFGRRNSDGTSLDDFVKYESVNGDEVLCEVKSDVRLLCEPVELTLAVLSWTTYTETDGAIIRICTLWTRDFKEPYCVLQVSGDAWSGHSMQCISSLGDIGARTMTIRDGRVKSYEERDDFLYNEQDMALNDGVNVGQCSFADDGFSLFYVSVEDGPLPDYINDDGTTTSREGEKKYQIWSCVVVTDADGNYKFTDPFPLAQLDRPVDSLAHVAMNNAYGFMYSSTTSMADSKSDLYFTAVPYVVHIEVTSLISRNPYVVAGETESFLVTARNDGNVVASKFTLQVGVEGESPIEVEVSIPDTESVAGVEDIATMQENGEDVVTHVVDAATEVGVLLPGSTKTYVVQIPIPETWHGKTEVTATVKEGSVQASEEDACAVLPEIRDNAKYAHTLGITAGTVSAPVTFAEAGASAAALRIAHNPYLASEDEAPENADAGEGSDGGDSDDGDGNGASGGDGAGDGSGTGLSKTGDDAGNAALAALAVALGAGGVAAATGTARSRRLARSQDEEEA